MQEPVFLDDGQKAFANDILAKFCKLGFSLRDIKYLILREEEEVYNFVKILRESNKGKYTPEEIEVLVTRVMTIKRVEEDF